MIGENSFFADSGFDAEMADPISHEQKTLLERLFISSITPGTYTPMAEVINGTHAAIFVDGKPFMAFGPASEVLSISQAMLASRTNTLRKISDGMKIEVKIMEPNDYDWTKAKQSGLCAIVSKPSYHREMGVGNGPLSAIMLGEKNDTTLAAATMMCVRPDIVSIIDPLNPISKCSEARFPHTSESVNDMISRYTDSGNTLFKNESDIKIVLSLVEPLIKYERSEISENELHNLLIERTPNFEEFFEATGKDEQDWENFLSDYSFQRNARKIITEQSLKNPSANTEQILEIIESELREIAKNEKGPVNSHENSPSKFEDAFVRNFADLSTRDFEIFTHQLSQTFKGDISDYINFIADYAKSEYANPEHLDLMGKNDNYSIVRVEVACNITTPVKTLNWMIQNDENPDVIEFAKETLEQIGNNESEYEPYPTIDFESGPTCFFANGTDVYDRLNNMSDEENEKYQELLTSRGITVTYDNLRDEYKVSSLIEA